MVHETGNMNGDSNVRDADPRGLIRIEKFWDFLHPAGRAIALDETGAIDGVTSNLLEFADAFERFVNMDWEDLPAAIRLPVNELGQHASILRKWVRSQPPGIRGRLARKIGIRIGKKRKPRAKRAMGSEALR